jgi:uncharacterized membrane protein
MSRTQTLAADERGLVGKILALWLVLGLVLLVVAYDVVQVGIARYRVADTAQTAAYEAASTLRSTRGDRTAAYQAAITVVEEDGVRLVEFVIDPQTEAVTVTVSDKASTLLVGRIGFLKGFAKARSSETSETAP